MQEFCNLAAGVMMAKDRQSECRFGDEYVTRHQFEWGACWIGDVLVIARGDDAQAAAFNADLCRAEDVASRMQAHFYAIEFQRLTVGNGLCPAREIIAITQTHDVQRFLRRQHSAMAGARMIGMPMRDQGLFNRPGRIDMKAAGLAAHA